LSEEKLFAQLSITGDFQIATKVALLDIIVQNLNVSVEKFFKPHVSRLVLKASQTNDLMAEVGTLGNGRNPSHC